MKPLFLFASVRAILFFVASPALAVAPLDTTFDYTGISYYPIGSGSASPQGLVQDSLQRLITVGLASSTAYFPFVARHVEGQIDSSFGVRMYTDYPGANTAVILDKEGSLLIAGSVTVPVSCGTISETQYFTVRKLNGPLSADDGTPDAGFGLGSARLPGTAIARVGGCSSNSAAAVVKDSDGYITAVGTATDDALFRSVIGLARWTPDGKADLNFNTDGTATFNVPASNYSSGSSIAVNSRDQLIVAANADSSDGNIGIILRYEKNGTVDTTFGNDGVFEVSLGRGRLCCVGVDKHDRILVGGAANSATLYPNKMLFLRLLDNGAFDKSFGVDGVARPTVSDSFESVNGMQLDAQERIVATGSADVGGLANITTVHLNSDGSLNSAMGDGGVYQTYVGFGPSAGTSVIIDSIGRLVVSGYGNDRDGYVPVLIRYDEMFGDGFD